MSDDDAAEETRNKLSQRFGNESRGNDNNDETDANDSNSDKNGKGGKHANQDNRENGGKQKNNDGRDNQEGNEQQEMREPWNSTEIERIKDKWSARTYYIPDEVTERLDREHDRLQYEVRDINIKQARHFAPVLLEYGLQEIEEMSGDEFKTALDELDILQE